MHDIRCNDQREPLAIDTAAPCFSWMVYDRERAQSQFAYQIIVATTLTALRGKSPDLWDSGKVRGRQNIDVRYGGKSLRSRQLCFWKVRVWDRGGKPSAWSAAACFRIGLLFESDWTAQWICRMDTGRDPSLQNGAPLLRVSYVLDDDIVDAVAYICGLGYYELYINGLRQGPNVLAPAFTQYDTTVLYDSYDITAELCTGENTVGIVLGNGWYNSITSDPWHFAEAPWRDNPKVIFQAHVRLANGEEQVIRSGPSWRCADGPITFNAVRNGQHYDARNEIREWSTRAFNASSWQHAEVARPPGGKLVASQMPPIIVKRTIRPVGFREIRPSVWVFDFGENISGWARLIATGPAGTEVTLRYAEKLDVDSGIDTSRIDTFVESGDFQTDRYILSGEGEETWEPSFTYHGFQYVEVTGFPGTPTLQSVAGRVVHTALESVGEFECSNDLINRIQECSVRSTLTNYHGFPTDCPHREKNGWTGDAALSAEQMLLNFDAGRAYAKWMRDFRDIQRPSGQLPGIVPTGGWGFNWGSGPAWDCAVVLIPWYVYLYRGTTDVLRDTYSAMVRYLDFLATMAEGHIVGFSLGDWCPPMGGPENSSCPVEVTDTAIYYMLVKIVSRVAGVLGDLHKSAQYSRLAGEIRDAYRSCFVNARTGAVRGECQTTLAATLYHGLADASDETAIFTRLVETVESAHRHIDAGILGAKYLLRVLAAYGRADLAYTIVTQETFPGWGYWITQGATTLWETWAGDQSRNHHMFSDVSAWFYCVLAGITPDPQEPGFRHTVVRPTPVTGLDWVRARHNSPHGWVECEWQTDAETLDLRVTVPTGCRATVHLPPEYPRPNRTDEAGMTYFSNENRGIAGTDDERQTVIRLDSGIYRIQSSTI